MVIPSILINLVALVTLALATLTTRIAALITLITALRLLVLLSHRDRSIWINEMGLAVAIRGILLDMLGIPSGALHVGIATVITLFEIGVFATTTGVDDAVLGAHCKGN